MTERTLPVPIVPTSRPLTAAAFQGLAAVPPEVEWFANLGNKATRRAYEHALQDFMRFTGISKPEEFRIVTRAHVIAWRDDLARRALSATTVRHRLSALASLFEYLCDKNAVTHNPVKGVKRPVPETTEGKTPALGDHQARKLLDAPAGDTIKAKRDRAILALTRILQAGQSALTLKCLLHRLRPTQRLRLSPRPRRCRGPDANSRWRAASGCCAVRPPPLRHRCARRAAVD